MRVGDCITQEDEAPHADQEQLYIDPVECIDCGACVPVPGIAIFALTICRKVAELYRRIRHSLAVRS